MMKRVLALVLCLASVLLCFTGCSKDMNDKGAYIRMYLTEPVYDLDPLAAFDNSEALQLVSLLFDGLFVADENGKPQKELVDKYKYVKDAEENIYKLVLTLKTTKWSDGTLLTANDVQFAFERLITSKSHPAIALLYDVKNARKICEGNESPDNLGVEVINSQVLEITFEHDIEVEEFLLALCSPALYPLRYDIVKINENWAKKPGTLICSGPFIVRSMNFADPDGFIIERNSYYFRDRTKDDLDKVVKPYRIIIDYKTSPVEQLKRFNAEENSLYYFGHIPLSARSSDSEFADVLDKLKLTDSPSTHTYYFNHRVKLNGNAIFANASVRKALSLAVDRDALVNAIVYAEAADGIVPHTVLNRPDKKTEFRDKADSYIASAANMEEAKKLLKDAGINASDYSFAITVNKCDEDHVAMAKLVKDAWASLGFKVTLRELGVKEIIDYSNKAEGEHTGMYKSEYREALIKGDFEVIALDLVATSADAFHYLAPFAKAFSGNAINMDTSVNPDYNLTPHISGYDSETYNAKIEAAFAAEKDKDRANLLHEAEAILMDEMPVIPMVYNKNAALSSKKLSSADRLFFCNADFTEVKLSGYWKIALRDEFTTEAEEDEE